MVRQFTVQKDDGTMWWMSYTSSGVKWTPISSQTDLWAGSFPTTPPSSPTTDHAASEVASTVQSGLSLLTGISGIQAIAGVGQAASMVGMWWEEHQRRLFDEARHEESRRVLWLGDMIVRWAAEHKDGDHLNLRVTEHLAREAKETMNVLVSNKKVTFPQSLLCDLGEIQDSLGAFRSLILTQFEELAASQVVDLDRAVREALPGRRFNLDFIRQLGKDPARALEASLGARGKRGFDHEFAEPLLHANGFTERVFPSVLPAVTEAKKAEEPGVLDQVVSFFAGALANLSADEVNPEAIERRTAFRELTLLPAEVLRVRALNSAWLATSAIVAKGTGREVGVQVGSRAVRVALETPAFRQELPARTDSSDPMA
ncbi:hypothetical protein [Tessaracoccus caeni]|uniref:hypothetical protein n=1 Tax=Tessaracoccus caeni TaxID=3031239 RepID=UPI0023DA4F57|nr:hypothetical protein [Tessaracoccus caeni]MDF1489436.1 hypothetical protein [Tessaracoccus caeni]